MRYLFILVALSFGACAGSSSRGVSIELASPAASTVSNVRPPSGRGDYASLLDIHRRFRALRGDRFELVDYRPTTVAGQIDALEALRTELEDCNVVAWSTSQQVDYVIVRSLFDQYEFMLRVARPWARDPGFYIDGLYAAAFTELPVRDEKKDKLLAELAEAENLVASAQQNLTEAARDYAELAVYNLTHSDGVGHGHPYRAEPPAGVLGWYDDFMGRAREVQPELLPAIEKARAAIADYERWLAAHMDSFTAPAGVGQRYYDWYLQHVKLMPFDSATARAMGRRELERLEAMYAMARHHHRSLPELEPAATKEDYEARIAEADRDVRAWLVDNAILTVPDEVGTFETNAPWIVRPEGRNFWEEIQFRDPRPDHVHAVIPGHRFDWWISERQVHPIRRKYWDAGRVEGWAVYVEELAMQTGLLDARPRTEELFLIFGMKRAVRVQVDVDMQLNRISVPEAVAVMRARVPFLDPAVARVDAEIYLRRPPGYGLSYTIGKLQLEALLARRAHSPDFNLTAFHDELLAYGRIPVALLEWEMTGEAPAHVWRTERLSRLIPALESAP